MYAFQDTWWWGGGTPFFEAPDLGLWPNEPFFETPERRRGGGLIMSFTMPDIDIGLPDISINPPPITIGRGGAGGSSRQTAVAIVNSYELAFQDNYNRYRSGLISASEAAREFDRLWQEMVARLMALGAEGQRAIQDRQAGGRWDWFAAYRPREAPPSTGLPGMPPPGAVLPSMPGADWKRIALLGGGAFVVWKLLR